jgi:hypothetical protein
VLRQTGALAAPSDAFAVSISLLSVKREGTAAAGVTDVHPCASDLLLTTGSDDDAAVDEGSSALAKSVPLH